MMSILPFRARRRQQHGGPEGKDRPERQGTRFDEQEALARLAADDPSALDLIIARFYDPLSSYALRLLEDVDVVEDVVQESFVRLWQHRRDCKARSLASYLFRVTRNLAFDEIRRRRAGEKFSASQGLDPHVAPGTPAEALEGERLALVVDAAIQALPSRAREVFTLTYLQGLSYREVAEIMGISPKTVGNHMTAALAELRRRLRPYVPQASDT